MASRLSELDSVAETGTSLTKVDSKMAKLVSLADYYDQFR